MVASSCPPGFSPMILRRSMRRSDALIFNVVDVILCGYMRGVGVNAVVAMLSAPKKSRG